MRLATRTSVGDAAWDDYVEKSRVGWFFHSTRWIDYAVEYAGGVDVASDVSHAAQDCPGGPLRGVDACVLSAQGRVHGGQPPPLPVGAFESSALVPGMVGRPGDRLHGAVEEWPTYVVDLRRDHGAMWTGLRRSYHSLIHAAERAYDIRVDAASPDLDGVPMAGRADVMADPELLHLEVAGRRTRPESTWRMMHAWVLSGHATCATAWSRLPGQDAELVGYAYAIAWKGWAYYASGAKRPACLGGVQHALLWRLMTELKARGVSHFEVGWGERRGDDAKAKGIAFFKSGFGGEAWTIQRL